MASVPGFFPFLRDERGLRPETCSGRAVELRKFEAFLQRSDISLSDLSPSLLGRYVAERAKSLLPTSLHDCTGALRVFLRYLHRENIIPADITRALPRGRKYKQSSLPRGIPWTDVQKVLDGVDRRSAVGKRDYAVLMLLASYGLRAREVAALELDDLDCASWAGSGLAFCLPAPQDRDPAAPNHRPWPARCASSSPAPRTTSPPGVTAANRSTVTTWTE